MTTNSAETNWTENLEKYSHIVVALVTENREIETALHRAALEVANITEEQLERYGENATSSYEHPQYAMYWATRSNMMAQLLGKTISNLVCYKK